MAWLGNFYNFWVNEVSDTATVAVAKLIKATPNIPQLPVTDEQTSGYAQLFLPAVVS